MKNGSHEKPNHRQKSLHEMSDNEVLLASFEDVFGRNVASRLTPEVKERLLGEGYESFSSKVGKGFGETYDEDPAEANRLLENMGLEPDIDEAYDDEDYDDQEPEEAWDDLTSEERGRRMGEAFGIDFYDDEVEPQPRSIGERLRHRAKQLVGLPANLARRFTTGLTLFATGNTNRRLKFQEKLDSMPDNERERFLEKRRKWFKRGAIGILGAVAVGGVAWKLGALDSLHGTGGTNMHPGDVPPPSGSKDGSNQPNLGDILPPDNGGHGNVPPDYFKMPDTASLFDAKHHVNDFGPGSLGLLNGDKGLAMTDLENMFRGNSHITASYLSELGIGDAPHMPSLEAMNDPVTAAQYHNELNAYADMLNSNPELRWEATQELMEKLHGAEFGDVVELQSGYGSWGVNSQENVNIFGTQHGDVFYDTQVNYSDVKFREVTIDGKLYYINLNCDQLSHGAVEVFTPAPAPVHTPVFEQPNYSPPPVVHDSPPPAPPHSPPQPPAPPSPPPAPPTPPPAPPEPTPPPIPGPDKNEANNPGFKIPDIFQGSPEGPVLPNIPEAAPPESYSLPSFAPNDNSPAPGIKLPDLGGIFDGGQRPQKGLSGPSGINSGRV